MRLFRAFNYLTYISRIDIILVFELKGANYNAKKFQLNMDRFVHWNAIEIRRPNISVWVSKYLFVYWFISHIRYIIKLIYDLHISL